jgi:hypothetical protein
MSDIDWGAETRSFIGSRASSAASRTATAVEDKPDNAARAIELSNSTGVPAGQIYNNLDNFERLHRINAGQAILDGNPQLQEYIADQPLASKVSNDDYGHLDVVGGHVEKLNMPEGWVSVQDVVRDAWKSVADVPKILSGQQDPDWLHVEDVVGTLMKQQGLPKERAELEAQNVMRTARRQQAINNLLWFIPTALGAPVISSIKNLSHEWEKRGGPPGEVTEGAAMVGLGVLGLAGHHVMTGKKTPTGVHEVIDQAKVEQSKIDVGNLTEAVREAQNSSTKGRAPEYFANYLRKYGDVEVGITPEAIREVYGDTMPAVDDGKLGWIPDLAGQLRRAELDGTDIHVNVSDLVSKIDPKIFSQIKDRIRARDMGITPEEARELQPAQPAATPEQALEQASGLDPLFERIKPPAEEPPTARMKQLELPEITRMEDRELIQRARDFGLTEEAYRRYVKDMDAERQAKFEADTRRVEKEEKRRQGREWKENAKIEREVAARNVSMRPDVSAINFLRDGQLPGAFGRVRPPKFDPIYLTEEQRATFPKELLAKGGENPHDYAGLFGHASGSEMIDSINMLERTRLAQGVRPAEFVRRLIDNQTELQMLNKYGEPSENVLNAIKERVLLGSLLDRLTEETILLAEKAKAQLPLPNLKPMATEEFMQRPWKKVSSDRLLEATGRTTNKLIDALQKDKDTEAFRLQQRREFAAHSAKLAQKLEEDVVDFEATIKRHSKDSVKGVDQPAHDAISIILDAVGRGGRRPLEQVQANLKAHGYSSLESYIKAIEGDGYDPHVQEHIWASPRQLKDLDAMTVGEFYEIKDAVDSLAHIGKEVNKIEVRGQKADFEEFRKEAVERIQSLGPKVEPNKLQKFLFRVDAELVRIEEIAKDLDGREKMGPLWDALIRPMMEAKHTEYTMTEALTKKIESFKGADFDRWIKTLRDEIPNDWFIDPNEGVPFNLTRESLINIALNWGTKSGRRKFLEGYFGREEAPAYEPRIMQMLDEHLTKEDWEFVNNMWSVFKDWIEPANVVYRNTSGVIPKWLPNEPIQTTNHGVQEGGYWPVFYRKGVVDQRLTADQLFGKDFYRATPGNHYIKERTGFIGQVEFNNTIEQVASRMQQTIHDISYRQAVIQVNKVIHDRAIKNAIQRHYGEEYYDQLPPWVKSIANHFNSNEEAITQFNSILRRIRFNLVAHQLGLNLKVILSPDVGLLNPRQAMSYFGNKKEWTNIAMENSKEIPHTFRNMDRDYRERLESLIERQGFRGWEASAARWGFLPVVQVSQQFRIITFVSEFRKAMEGGMGKADAAAWADSLVRERHGAAGLPDLPAIMRTAEGFKPFTMFYGFFNTMYNWQRQLPGAVFRRGDYGDAMKILYGSVLIPAAFGATLFNQRKEGDSWWKVIAKALPLQLLSTVPFARDMAELFIEGIPSRSPLGSLLQSVSSLVTDVSKYVIHRKTPDKPIQHLANVVGISRGLPMAQPGRTSQFMYDWLSGKPKKAPRSFSEFVHGIITGEARLKK